MTDKLVKRFVIIPTLDIVISEDGTKSIKQGRELVTYSSNGVELSRITAPGNSVEEIKTYIIRKEGIEDFALIDKYIQNIE